MVLSAEEIFRRLMLRARGGEIVGVEVAVATKEGLVEVWSAGVPPALKDRDEGAKARAVELAAGPAPAVEKVAPAPEQVTSMQKRLVGETAKHRGRYG